MNVTELKKVLDNWPQSLEVCLYDKNKLFNPIKDIVRIKDRYGIDKIVIDWIDEAIDIRCFEDE